MSQAEEKGMYDYIGLQYDKTTASYYGTFQGFRCSVKMQRTKDVAVVTIPAVLPEDSTHTPGEVSAALTQLSANQSKKITNALYHDHLACATLLVGRKPKPQEILEMLRGIADTLIGFGMTACCGGCGAGSAETHAVNEDVMFLCPNCLAKVESQLAQNQQACSEIPESPLLGAVGAVAGSAAMFLLIWVLWLGGYIAYIVGAAGMLASMFLYQKLAKRISIKGVAISMTICLATAVFASFFCVANTVAGIFADEAVSGTYTEAYATEVRGNLEQISQLDALSDEDLLIAADSTDITDVRAQLAKIRETENTELENVQFVADHTTTMSCLKDINAVSEWAEDDSGLFGSAIWGQIVENLLWNVLSALLTGLLLAKGMIEHSNGVYKIRTL